jgi:hypothetical protein
MPHTYPTVAVSWQTPLATGRVVFKHPERPTAKDRHSGRLQGIKQGKNKEGGWKRALT